VFKFVNGSTCVLKSYHLQCYTHNVQSDMRGGRGKVCASVSQGEVCEYSVEMI